MFAVCTGLHIETSGFDLTYSLYTMCFGKNHFVGKCVSPHPGGGWGQLHAKLLSTT